MHLHDRGRHPPDSRAVALDAQPLANTTARGMSVRQGRYALAVLAMATAAFGAPLDLSLDAYRVAAADGPPGRWPVAPWTRPTGATARTNPGSASESRSYPGRERCSTSSRKSSAGFA